MKVMNQTTGTIEDVADSLPIPLPGPVATSPALPKYSTPKYEHLTHREVPVSSKRYFIHNVGRKLWLNLAESKTTDGNFVLAWKKSSPEGENETWRITEPEKGQYTIECRTALLAGVNGYVGLKDNKTVNCVVPFLWRFEEIERCSRVYQIKAVTPQHDTKGTNALSAVYEDGFKDWMKAQAEMVTENKQDENQQWIFIKAPVAPYGSAEPITGRTYHIVNVGRERWLDLANSDAREGNFVIAWHKNSQPTANQVWMFEGTLADCTLRNLSSLREMCAEGNNSDAHGSYLHIQNEKTIISMSSYHWDVEPAEYGICKLHPVDRPETSLTCVTDQLISVPESAAKLETTSANDDAQLWAFIPAIELV